MEKIKSIPTSKLVFASVYPECIQISTRKCIDEEIFLRLTREFKLSSEQMGIFLRREKDKICDRGDNIDDYFFGGNRTLDESLKAFYERIDLFKRYLGKIDSKDFTFSEAAYFNGIFSTLCNYYKRRSEIYLEQIHMASNDADRILGFNDTPENKALLFKGAKRYEERLMELRNMESELISIYNMFANMCLEKMMSYMGTMTLDSLAMAKCSREVGRIHSRNRSSVMGELKFYKDISNEVFEHDTSILSEYDIGRQLLMRR